MERVPLEDGFRHGEMVADRPFGRFGVSRDTCSEDLAVALGFDYEGVVRATEQRQRCAVALPDLERLRDEPCEPPRTGSSRDREVIAGVAMNESGAVAQRVGLVERPDTRGQLSLQLVVAAHRAVTNGERLESDARVVDDLELADGQVRHACTLVGRRLGNAKHLELPDRLADRRDAHVQGPGQLFEPQRRALRDRAHDDPLAQRGERGLRHRLARSGFRALCGWKAVGHVEPRVGCSRAPEDRDALDFLS